MTPRLKSTRAARDLIKAHEPFLATAERRGKRWVVGYGHTAAAKEGVTLKPEDAELLLIYDVMRAEQTLDACVGAEMAAPMRDALVSFALSVGLRAFKVSDVARLARDGRHREAAAAIETWVRADQDGRLVVSDRLVARRAAEKALYLSGLEDSAAMIVTPVEPAPAQAAETPALDIDNAQNEAPVEAEPAATIKDAPEAIETPESEPEPEAEPVIAAESDEAGDSALVELDIAFEFPEEAEDADSLAIPDVMTAVIASDDAVVDAEDDNEAEPEAEAHEPDETPVEGADAETEALAEDSAPAEAESASQEIPVFDADESVEDEAEAQQVKAAQDAAIAAVMARMARQVSASMTTEEATGMDAGDATVKLGYSFLSTAHVELRRTPVPARGETVTQGQEARTAAPQSQPQPVSSGSSLFSSPMVPLSAMGGSLQVSSIKVTPIAPQALPQGASDTARSQERAAPLTDQEDALTVKLPSGSETQGEKSPVSTTQVSGMQLFAAPPHPALAPASAPGLSGDVEGPDHPDKDRDDHHTDMSHPHEDDEALDPAVVSGIQASIPDEGDSGARRGGDVMFISSLALGGLMVGLGGWDIAANMDAYMELGLAYSPLGPTVFGAGVLLSAASAWFIIGRRNEK